MSLRGLVSSVVSLPEVDSSILSSSETAVELSSLVVASTGAEGRSGAVWGLGLLVGGSGVAGKGMPGVAGGWASGFFRGGLLHPFAFL